MQMLQRLGMRIITYPVIEAQELYPWCQVEIKYKFSHYMYMWSLGYQFVEFVHSIFH